MTIRGEEDWDLAALRGAEKYQRWILDEFRGSVTGKVLEVGAGNGNFTRWISKTADEVLAIEPDDTMGRELTALGLPNVSTTPKLLGDLSPNGAAFDSVVMINVLEHIEDDDAALKSAKEILRDGGCLCILVPAHPALYSFLDRRFGHFRRYRKAEVAEKLENAGFRVKKAEYFNPIGALAWFVAFTLLRSKKVTPLSVKVSDFLIVPLSRMLSRLGFRPFGQSVVAIAVKESRS